MQVGDEQAFLEFSRLTDEQKATLTPTLITVYNEGLRQKDCIRSLLDIESPDAQPVFEDALSRSDDSIAALGARGLAALEANDFASNIAQRLMQVTTSEEFAPFMDSLLAMPTPEAAEVVARIVQRNAGRIGGINTIRNGCRLFAKVPPTEETINAMVYSLINFVPLPYEDAINECELALLEHADAVTPALIEVFNQENESINELLRNNQYPLVIGSSRAALVMAHIHNDPIVEAITAWYSVNHEVPRQELANMDVQQQMEWYNNHGQLFDVTTMALAYNGSDRARETLLAAEHRSGEDEEATLLNNFVDWFGLSDGAEVGLRQPIHEALSMINNPEDRDLLWERAISGNVQRGGIVTDTMLRVNVLHYLGRSAQADEMPRYEEALQAQNENFLQEFTPLRAYWVLAQQCQENIDCYAAAITDPSTVAADETLQGYITGEENEQVQAMITMGINSSAQSGGLWQLAIRFGDQAEAQEALVANMGTSDMMVRMQIAEAMLVIEDLPANTVELIDAQLEADAGRTGVQMLREFRQAVRVVKLVRF